jgi:hypothetical protein
LIIICWRIAVFKTASIITKWEVIDFPEAIDLQFSKILYFSENQAIMVGGSSNLDFRCALPNGKNEKQIYIVDLL